LKLLLASASPQRRKLLTEAGFEFDVDPADVPEVAEGLEPAHIAVVNAEAKAHAVANRHADGSVVLGADTVVDLNGMPLGQPENEEQARMFLAMLSDGAHEVHTAVCVVAGEVTRTGVSSSRVHFRELSDSDIDSYISTGEWIGRAGGYAIQESGASLVTEVEGDFNTVVGLPMDVVRQLLPDSVQPA